MSIAPPPYSEKPIKYLQGTTEKIAGKMTSGFSKAKNFMKGRIDAVLNSSNSGKYIILGVIFMVVSFVLYYLYSLSTYTGRYCGYLNTLYTKPASIGGLDVKTYKDNKLRDFYIKTAYNCCALNTFTNTFVDMCALKKVLAQGVRCLDFEIYDVDNKPVIAVSGNDSYYFKQSFNSIDVTDALQYIVVNAFSGAMAPNPNDPLILHFRLKTQHVSVINKLGTIIKNVLGERLLNNNYSDAYFGKNLGGVPIVDFMGKIIIATNVKNKEVLKANHFLEVVNIESGSPFLRQLRKHDVLFTPSSNELVTFNKQNMSIALPDVGNSNENLPVHLCQEYGIQMIAMCYQNFDTNLEINEEFFGENNSAFVLKPESLRYEPIVIEKPKPLAKSTSFAPRHIEKPYYKFKI